MSLTLMEIGAIFTIVGTIFAIITFLLIQFFGIQSIIDFIKGKKRPKEQDIPPTIPTRLPQRETLQTQEVKDSRGRFLEACQSYVMKQKVDERLRQDIDEKTMLDPMVGLSPESNFLDFISSAIIRSNEVIVILPSGESEPDLEGIGRTTLILRVLGIQIPYGRLLALDQDSIERLNEIAIDISSGQKKSRFQLIDSDMAFIGTNKGILSLIPVNGEKLTFTWDIARHIYRQTELNYHTGDHRLASASAKLMAIFTRIPYNKIVNLYGQLGAIHSVDRIVILRRNISSTSQLDYPCITPVSDDERKEKLRRALMVSSGKHGSRFWHRNPEAISVWIDNILDSIDWTRVCPIYEICYEYPSSVVPQHVFNEVADLIIGSKAIGSMVTPEMTIQKGIGLHYHNNELFKALRGENEITFIGNSGEHLFKDSFFWKILSQLDKQMKLDIYLLDPSSEATETRQKEAYGDKTPDFLRKEIEGNIETIRRMTALFLKKYPNIQINCWMYNELPRFRMTFIGDLRVLIASYSLGRRTDYDTVFYNIPANTEHELYIGFERELEKIRTGAVKVV